MGNKACPYDAACKCNLIRYAFLGFSVNEQSVRREMARVLRCKGVNIV